MRCPVCSEVSGNVWCMVLLSYKSFDCFLQEVMLLLLSCLNVLNYVLLGGCVPTY